MEEKDINTYKFRRVGVFDDTVPDLSLKKRLLTECFKDAINCLFSVSNDEMIVERKFASEDIKGTPDRMARALIEMTRGYYEDPTQYLNLFDYDGKPTQMVTINKIHYTSLCEHHLLPFSGYVSVGYIPNKKIAGLSKFSRIIDCFAHRLQLQEKLTIQIFEFLKTNLDPKELFVRIIGEHDCISCRGVNQKDSNTITIIKTDGIDYQTINNFIKD